MDFLKLLHMSWTVLSVITQFDPSHQLTSNEHMSQTMEGCDKLLFSCKRSNICNCDPLCAYYDDCCYDASNAESVTRDEQSNYANLSECRSISFDGGHSRSADARFVISKCPPSWKNTTVKARCEVNNNISSVLDAALVSNVNGEFIFKNRFCAACHRVLDFIMLDMEIKCRTLFTFEYRVPFTQAISNAMSMEGCAYRYITESRHCYNHYVNLQNLKEIAKNTTACFTGNLGPIVIEDGDNHKTYIARSSECAKQIIDILRFSKGRVYCFLPVIKQLGNTYGSIIKMSKLWKLMSIEAHDCREMEINLSLKDGCQDLHCPYDFVPFFGECLNKSIITNDTTGMVFEFFFQANDTAKTDFYEDFREAFIPVLKHVSPLAFRYGYIISKSVNGSNIDNVKRCTVLRLIIVVKSFVSHNATFRRHMNIVLRQQFRGYSTVQMNVLFEYIENIDESTCKINTSLDNSRHTIPNFDTFYNQHVPCPAVIVHRFNETNGTASTSGDHVQNMLYRIPSTMTIINEDDLVRIGNEYYLCTRTYYNTYALSSTGSSLYYTGLITNMAAVTVAIWQWL